jgi:hypothetical protein
MAAFVGELVLSVVDPKMLLIPQVEQAVLAAPAIRMNGAFQADAATNDCLQSHPAAIGHDLDVNAALAFEDAENKGFSGNPSPSKSVHSARPEVVFSKRNFADNRGLLLAKRGNPHAKFDPADFRSACIPDYSCHGLLLAG